MGVYPRNSEINLLDNLVSFGSQDLRLFAHIVSHVTTMCRNETGHKEKLRKENYVDVTRKLCTDHYQKPFDIVFGRGENTALGILPSVIEVVDALNETLT